MAGKPWEKYQATETKTAAGPWTKYQEAPAEDGNAFTRTLDKIDQYSGAPVRKFMGSLQDDAAKGDESFGAVGRALKAGYHQIGAPTKDAPSATDIVDKDRFIGTLVNNPTFQESFSQTPQVMAVRAALAPFVNWDKSGELAKQTPKMAATAATGAALDPIAHVPITPFIKPATKAYGLLPEVVKSPIKSAGGVIASGAEFLTGVPKAAWKNYIENPQSIKAIEEVHGNNVADAADTLREGWQLAIQQKKKALGDSIEAALANAPRKAKIDPAPIINSLNEAKRGLNPNITEHAAAIAQIDEHINQVRALAPQGKLTVKDAYDLQKIMRQRGASSYVQNGAMFNPAPAASKAAKNAAYQARQIVNQLAPDIAKANEALSELHGLEETIRPSIYTPGKSSAGLMSPLGRTQTEDLQALENLGQWLDRDLVREAKDFATYKRFQGMGNDAADQTGKAVYRLLGGSLAGGLAGGSTGDPGKAAAGALLGAAGTNPKLVRGLLDAGLMAKGGVQNTFGKGGLLDKRAEDVRPFIQALERRLNPTLEKGVKAAEDFILDEAGAFTPGQVKGFLNKEGAYDLKKARETAGPAKGLLPGEGNNPVAKYRAPLSKEERADLLNWIDSAYNTLRRGERFSPVDEKYLREVLPVAPDYQKKYVKDLLEQIEKQKNPTSDLEELKQLTTTSESTKPAVEAAKNFKPGQVITSEDGKKWTVLDNTNKGGLIMLRDEAGNTTHDYADSLWQYAKRQLQPDEPRGLLTNLNVERGPVREGVQPSRPAPFVLENGRPPELKPGTLVDLPNGKSVITVGEYSHFEPGQGRVYWVEPSANAGFEPGSSGHQYQISEKDMLGEKYADYFAGKQSELDASRKEYSEFNKRFNEERAANKATEAEREAKKVVSVDVPKRVNNAARADFEKIQKLREKVNNGKQITDSEFEYLKGMLGEYDGALHDEAMHVIEGDWRLMGKSKPKSKPTKPKGKK